HQLHRFAAKASCYVPIIYIIGDLELAGVGQYRVHAYDESRFGFDPEPSALFQILVEPMILVGQEGHFFSVEYHEAVMPDVRNPGLGICRYRDACRDIGTPVLRAVDWDGKALNVDAVANNDVLLARRRP